MKFNKFLTVLALCAAMQSNVSICSDVLRAEGPAPVSQSYWQQYAPQRVQDLTGYVSKQATSAYDAVSKWSTKKKLVLMSAIIGSLVGAYGLYQMRLWTDEMLLISKEYNEIETEYSNLNKEIAPLLGTPSPLNTKETKRYLELSNQLYELGNKRSAIIERASKYQ